MLLNPYYYIFCVVIKKLKQVKVQTQVQDEDLLFLSYSFLFLMFIPHFFFLLFQLKDYQILTFDVNIPKHLFGVGFALGFWLINYLLFGWKKRYIKILEGYEMTSKGFRIINLVLLLIYFAIPFILMAA